MSYAPPRRFRALCIPLAIVALAVATSGAEVTDSEPGRRGSRIGGEDERVRPSRRPSVEAWFARESYPPGATARLVIASAASRATMQLFRAGTESTGISPHDLMLGSAVSRPKSLGALRPGDVVRVRIGSWPSGLYFARLVGADRRIGFAPFVLRPRRIGDHPVAIVLPTFTWQAYNFRDDDGDGDADTWYAGSDEQTVRIGRPYENRGVPPHYKHYDQPFLRWLSSTGRRADFLADTDLHRIGSGRALARAYELVIFPGHHEYVTERELNAIASFRNRGGNLAFLSANNFFWRVDLARNTIRRVARWRDLGRPEAALIGVQYVANDRGHRKAPWVVRDDDGARWLFAGTGLRNGSTFSRGGVEIDALAPSSPAGTRVVADIRNVFGPGRSAQMTFYETRAGAKVFAAGAFMLVRDLRRPRIGRMLENIWVNLAPSDARR